jgi:hypothetical protein
MYRQRRYHCIGTKVINIRILDESFHLRMRLHHFQLIFISLFLCFQWDNIKKFLKSVLKSTKPTYRMNYYSLCIWVKCLHKRFDNNSILWFQTNILVGTKIAILPDLPWFLKYEQSIKKGSITLKLKCQLMDCFIFYVMRKRSNLWIKSSFFCLMSCTEPCVGLACDLDTWLLEDGWGQRVYKLPAVPDS